ncbi:MAG TPA: hypothetical protein VGK30_00850 [Candidatus Binatia bacterium]
MTGRTARRRLSGGPLLRALLVLAAVLLAAPRLDARELKLWPFFDYQSDPESGSRRLRILGPILEYASDPVYRTFAFRPLFSVRQARVGHDDEVNLLYPFLTSRWQNEEQTTKSFGGLLSYRTTTSTDGKTLISQRFRALPLYFYDWDGPRGARASLVPLYADLEDVAGYSRVQMVAFPGYLRLVRPEYQRRYWLYPFFDQVSGPHADGFGVWPAYGRMHVEGRYDGGYTAWPFYVWDAHTRDGETERRFTSFPFYSTVEGPHRQSVAYGGVLYVHSRDERTDLESTAFPWPLWESERRMSTGEQVTTRLLPFYEWRQEGALETRRVAWPLFTEHRYDDGVRAYRRIDGFVILVHDEHDTDVATGKTSHVFALFPGVVDVGDGSWDRGNAPALADAMVPEDRVVRRLYAPLWSAYAWDGSLAEPRVSMGWGAVEREGTQTTGPWRFDPGDQPDQP